jgi:hypothetical protein
MARSRTCLHQRTKASPLPDDHSFWTKTKPNHMRAIKTMLKAILPYQLYSPAQRFVRHVTSYRYRGTTFACPFCLGHFSTFLPAGYDYPVLKELRVIGGGYRDDCVCPRCYSEDRERLILLFLRECQPELFSRPVTLLHIAPELNLAALLKVQANIRYISADLNSPAADVRMDITAIDSEADSFDAIICNHVLEHIPDDGLAMREVFRVLKAGGFAILQVPISPVLEKTREDWSITGEKERMDFFGQEDHVRIYGQDYAGRLRAAGFTLTATLPRDFLSADQIRECSLLEEEKVFFCEKK